MTNVIYICDRKQPCSVHCLNHKGYPCHHTSNPDHAKNGTCERPWEDPARFEVFDEIEGRLPSYWERV